MTPACRLRGVGHCYGRLRALDGVDLEVAAGSVCCLLGPSGCGKSTLLRLVAGLENLREGAIEVDGRNVAGVPPEARGVGMVFQDFALFPHLRVEANIAFGLRGLAPGQRRQRVAGLLEDVGLAGRERDWPHTLSGGQQQRVALARALAPEPALLLLDEPFSGLDASLRWQLRADLRRLIEERGVAAMVVTHDAEEACHLGDTLALLEAGRLVQSGAPATCWARPASAFVAGFLGDACQVVTTTTGGRAAIGRLAVPTTLADGPTTVVLRHGALQPDERGVPLPVVAVRWLAGDELVTLDAGEGHHLVARWPAGRAPSVGTAVGVVADPANTFCFPA